MYIYFYFYEDELLYIGSTEDIKAREGNHRSEFKKGNPMKIYNFLRKNGMCLDDLEKEVVKTELTDRDELYVLEHDLMAIYEPLYNENSCYTPGRTTREWYQDNKERQAEYYKEYRSKKKRRSIVINIVKRIESITKSIIKNGIKRTKNDERSITKNGIKRKKNRNHPKY